MPNNAGLITLAWSTDRSGTTYVLTEVSSDGQIAMLDSFDQGPFDTSLEVAQWAWRTISKRLPPSRC